ncbi:hypothetical protein GJU41_19705 [Bacillus idriensis]|uniref:ATPase BadF/BadG/BcrA/BcrD type domain-containing protein n=1 Tax=Metabacillus idriensis TaxID=324768 RepID=A0A6I2MD36_9BACI|nr:BadF/BadG/BcrA/BcrD ATPase family protein [Metabacillus idriensis]MRX56188.1 hypothetical protein [Metabacillus idriensis]
MFSSGLKKVNNAAFPLLAVDGGGTKTLAVITDSKGNVMGIGRSHASNYQVAGIKGANNALFEAINEVLLKVCEKKEMVKFQTGVFALAGIDTSEDRDVVKRMVNDVCHRTGIYFEKLIVENDALSTLIGATSNQPGALVISGTGSIAFAHNGRGEYVRAGGWGHKVGDEGSGYWIGMEAIRAILKMSDGRGPNTLLKDRVLEAINLPTVESLYNWVYGTKSSVDTIGAIAQIVEACTVEGDAVSKNILDSATDELFSLLYTVMDKTLDADEKITIVLQGGILKHNQYIQKQLGDKVKGQFPNSRLILANLEPFEYIVQRGLLNNSNIDI